jgi:RNA polymerase sigma factor CnrH
MDSLDLLGRIVQALAAFASGEESDALKRRLIEQHHYLLALLRYKTRDDSLAEDLLQESYLAFLSANPDPSRFADGVKLRNYLVTIALNKLRDHWRKEGGAKRRSVLFRSREDLNDWMESLPSNQGDPTKALIDREEDETLSRAVAFAMERLPEGQRRALELKFAKDMDNPSIAEELGLGVKAVESLLFRAKARFRKEFEKTGLGENEAGAERVDYGRDRGHGP